MGRNLNLTLNLSLGMTESNVASYYVYYIGRSVQCHNNVTGFTTFSSI